MTATRTRRLATITCAGLAMAASGCGAAGSDDPLIGVLTRADAADSSLGVRYAFRTRTTDDDGSQRARGYGQAEADQRRERIVVVDGVIRGETIVDGDDEYSGGDLAFAGLLGAPENVRWTKLDRGRFLDAGYLDTLCGRQLPAKVAGVLADSDPTIEKLGAGRVGRASMQRFRVTTTHGRILDVLAGDDDASDCPEDDRADTVTAELWIDRDDLIRRVRLRYRIDGATVETRTITGYDRDVRVEVPRGSSVADVTDELIKLADSVCEMSDIC